MHSHRMVRNVTERAFRLAITEEDVIMMYLPLFHLFAFSEGMLTSMVSGARQVLTESFDAAESLDLVARERATVIHGFDTHYKELCEAHERRPRDVSTIRTGILAAGMSSSTPIARRARTLFGPLVSGYGMSEFGVGVTIGALDSTEEQSCEASGYPAPGYEIRVVDPATGHDQPAGTPGEILVRGYTVTRGYYNKPEATAATIDADGFVHTGDMGIIRADGHLRFVGRYKDMLKIGGENVDPMEVEAYLMSHPAINLAAVVSYPDARLSEVGVAFVRCEPGHALTEDDVIAHCRGRIASFKIPRAVIFVDEFPMTSSGKIQKVKLREAALRRGEEPSR
jgi:fatty-acyl-CoA synthase